MLYLSKLKLKDVFIVILNQDLLDQHLALLNRNYDVLKATKGIKYQGMIVYGLTLSQTLRNEDVRPEAILKQVELIKSKTKFGSLFRGHALYYLALELTRFKTPELELDSILTIYEQLTKQRFARDTYLPFTAIIINTHKDILPVEECIKNTKMVYDFMKKQHRFLTSSEDYSRAALIAIHAKTLDEDLAFIEHCYSKLSSQGFKKSNDLQALSHILALSSEKDNAVIDKVIHLNQTLKANKCELKGPVMSLLGALSLLDVSHDVLAAQINYVMSQLKTMKGFKTFSLGKQNQIMIACALVAACYTDKEANEQLSVISENLFIDIVIAIETAMMMTILMTTTVSNNS